MRRTSSDSTALVVVVVVVVMLVVADIVEVLLVPDVEAASGTASSDCSIELPKFEFSALPGLVSLAGPEVSVAGPEGSL